MKREHIVGGGIVLGALAVVLRFSMRAARLLDDEAPDAAPPAEAEVVAEVEDAPAPLAHGLRWEVGAPPDAVIALDVPPAPRHQLAFSQDGSLLLVSGREGLTFFRREGEAYGVEASLAAESEARAVALSADGTWAFVLSRDGLSATHRSGSGWSSLAVLPTREHPIRSRWQTIRVSSTGDVVALGNHVLHRRGARWTVDSLAEDTLALHVAALSPDGERALFCAWMNGRGATVLYDVSAAPRMLAYDYEHGCVGALLGEEGEMHVLSARLVDRPGGSGNLEDRVFDNELIPLTVEGSRLLAQAPIQTRCTAELSGTWADFLCAGLEEAGWLERGELRRWTSAPQGSQVEFAHSADGERWAASGPTWVRIFTR